MVKIMIDIFNNDKLKLLDRENNNDELIVIWFKLLTLRGRNNGIDGSLYFHEDIPFTEELIASNFNRPLKTIRIALKLFKEYDMIYETKDKVLIIKNWNKYQNN